MSERRKTRQTTRDEEQEAARRAREQEEQERARREGSDPPWLRAPANADEAGRTNWPGPPRDWYGAPVHPVPTVRYPAIPQRAPSEDTMSLLSDNPDRPQAQDQRMVLDSRQQSIAQQSREQSVAPPRRESGIRQQSVAAPSRQQSVAAPSRPQSEVHQVPKLWRALTA